MARVAILNYIKRPSLVHELTGTTKLIFFIAWSVASMITFDTRILVCMLVIGAVIFRLSQIRIKDISVVLGLAAVFLLLNNIFIYLFTSEYGVELYESRTLLFAGVGRYTVTAQQLFYHLNITLKVICVVPDVQREYTNISQAQQARGIDLSGKDKLFTRLKNSVAILLPLVMSSLNRIETVSNAMELRGFGKEKKRTWYTARGLKRNDWLTIGFAAAILAIDLMVTFWDGSRYYNPFL